MNIQPVIHRELRAGARRSETWRLRLVFGLGAALAFLFGMIWPHTSWRERGMVLLVCLSVAGFVFSLLVGAYLTADAVAAEKREGTLGLLFLTPLRGWEIILGKMAMHSVQVGYALLGGFPFFFLPILLGGVLWVEVARILLVLLLTLSVSLALGIFFSTILREVRTAVLATGTTMLLLTLLPWAPPFLLALFSGGGSFNKAIHLAVPSPMTALVFAFESKFRLRSGAGGDSIYWASVVWLGLLATLLVIIAGAALPRVWRKLESGERPQSSPSETRIRTRTVPRWALPMNSAPLIWLAARNLAEPVWLSTLRVFVLVVFAGMLALSILIANNDHEYFITAFCACYGLHLITRVQLLLAGTRGLLEDRQSGALEAILATPVLESELMDAHHESLTRGFQKHFVTLLATNVALQAVVFAGFKKLDMSHGAWAIFTAFFMGGIVVTATDFVAIRWLSLRESLRRQTQLKAVGRVFLMTLLIPWIAFGLTFVLAVRADNEVWTSLIFFGWAGLCSVYLAALLKHARKTVEGNVRRLVAEG